MASIDNILEKFGNDWVENINIIIKEFGHTDYVDQNGIPLLHLFVEKRYDEQQVLKGIKSLLHVNYNANVKNSTCGNFIQLAIDVGYSENFIFEVTKLALQEGGTDYCQLDPNLVDSKGNTILHTAIKSSTFTGDIVELYKLLYENGFVVDKYKEELINAIKISKKYTLEEEKEFKKLILETSNKLYQTPIDVFNYLVRDEDIESMISNMTNNGAEANIGIILKTFKHLNYRDVYGQSILGILVDKPYDEHKVYLAIKSLLEHGMSPNLTDAQGCNFIQNAIMTGYSEVFVINTIKLALEYGLDVDHVNSGEETILDTMVSSEKYRGNITLVSKLFYKKESLEKNEQEGKKDFLKSLSKEEIEELEEYGSVLTCKDFLSAPTIGRERELKNLMITLAQDKKLPIIVGEPGVGKTAIVDELAYRIKTNAVPNFLKNKVVLEISPSDIIAGCELLGSFERKMGKIFELCERYDVILFIDEIHTIYGTGAAKNKDTDMATILKHRIDRTGLKVIGATTEEEYQKYFSADALKRRFEKILVKEPDDDILTEIIDKTIDDYCFRSGLRFEHDGEKKLIVDVLVNSTYKNYRVYNDRINNPDLSISIIDKAFAFAKYNDDQYISKEHFMESLSYCERLYETTRDRAIRELKGKKISQEPKGARILNIDFTKLRR